MRKLFISADLEGCASVSSQNALTPDRWEWGAARRWITGEVVAVCEAALAAGYDEVIVADGHGNAHSIEPDSLPNNVWLIRSWPRPLLQMEGIQDGEIKACVFIGYHAGSASRDSILAHTYHGGVYRTVKVNGELCSEGYLNAALAGEFNAPVVFISGDEHTVEDSRRYSPESVGFVAKRSIGFRSQRCLPPTQVRSLMKEAIAAALTRPLPPPFTIKGPLHLELEMTSHTAAEMLSYLPGVERTGPWTVGTRFDRMEAAMRFISFGMLYSPTGVMAL